MIRRRRGDTNTRCGSKTSPTWDRHRRRSAHARRAARVRCGNPDRSTSDSSSRTSPSSASGSARARSRGATMVGINPTRRGAELASDIRHTDCQLVVTEPQALAVARRSRPRASRATASSSSTPTSIASTCDRTTRRRRSRRTRRPTRPALLVFTSGTTGRAEGGRSSRNAGSPATDARSATARSSPPSRSATWRCRCSTPTRCTPVGRRRSYVGARSRCAGASPRRRSSTTSARYGATYFNYVGKPLSYILATPASPDDRDHTLARPRQRRRRTRHRAASANASACRSPTATARPKAASSIRRSADQPQGRARPRCPRACSSSTRRRASRAHPREFDDDGPAAQPDECIGEIVEQRGPSAFEGYYKNDEADARADAQRLVLVGRPRLPRRRRMASGSPGATTTGCGSTARTSPPRPSNASSRAFPASCSPRCTPCPRPTSATR